MSERKAPLSRDGFENAREGAGVLVHASGGERIPLILRHRDVRAAARDWERFSSDAPCRVPIPSEENVRSIRQIPIELDPPLHTAYRKAIEPWFLRPTRAQYREQVAKLVAREIKEARSRDSVEIVSEFALPLQSRALALLLGLPESEAELWISWGNSLYRDGDGAAKGAQVDDYGREQVTRARGDAAADNFFAHLARLEVNGAPLSDEELAGIINLVFAGGRDTVINAVSEVIGHFARVPEDAALIASDPRLIAGAVEEFVRLTSPLAMIGRVCPHGGEVNGARVDPGARVGLCWAAANHDAEVFDEPERFLPTRKPNPHMGFGSGKHACLGAAHARAILGEVVAQIAPVVPSIEVLDAVIATEDIAPAKRRLGYEKLRVRFG